MKPTGSLVIDIICRTAEIGLTITGVADASTIAITDAASVAASSTCPECEHPGKLRDHILRQLVNLPVIGLPNRLDVHVPHLLCTAMSYPRKIFQASLTCADGGSKLTRRATRWTLQRLVIDQMSASVTVKALGIDWDLVDQVTLDVCRQLVYDDLHHLDGVCIFGVDGYVWEYIRKPGQSSNLVVILVNLTPLIDGRDPVRLLDLRSGYSAEVLCTWLQECDPGSRSQVQVVTTDGFVSYVSAANQVPPDAAKVMDPFHIAHLAADKLTGCQQRLQREAVGRRGRKDGPPYKHHRTLLIRTNYLTQRQKQRLGLLWATDDGYVAFEMTWLFYQDTIAAYRYPKRSGDKKLVSRTIDSLRKGPPAGLEELAQLGHTL